MLHTEKRRYKTKRSHQEVGESFATIATQAFLAGAKSRFGLSFSSPSSLQLLLHRSHYFFQRLNFEFFSKATKVAILFFISTLLSTQGVGSTMVLCQGESTLPSTLILSTLLSLLFFWDLLLILLRGFFFTSSRVIPVLSFPLFCSSLSSAPCHYQDLCRVSFLYFPFYSQSLHASSHVLYNCARQGHLLNGLCAVLCLLSVLFHII